MDAKVKEIKNLTERNVFECVEDHGQSTVSTRWVFHRKVRQNGEEYLKARLVARGFEENLQDTRTDSPTCSRQSLRMALATAPIMSWKLHSLDITAAFLQGSYIDRDVFVRPPHDFIEDGKLWKLRRCMYGLNDAPRMWYDRVVQELKNLNGKVSTYDNAMFLWHDADGN